MIFLKSYLTLIIITTIINADNVDFVTVYRYLQGPNNPKVTTELHRLTNGLGLPLRNSHNYFIDSVEGMPPLNCSPATMECQWIKTGTWAYTEMDLEDDDILSVKIEDKRFDYRGLYNSCDTLNGGCQMLCSMEDSNPNCSCPSGLSSESTVSCKSACPTCAIPVSTPGKFEKSVRFPSVQTWYFVAPGHTALILNMRTNGQLFSVHTSELNTKGEEKFLSVKPVEIDLWTRSILKLRVSTQAQEKRRHFRKYTEYGNVIVSGDIKFRRDHLQLKEENGTLSYNITSIADSICVSVIYKNQYGNAAVDLKTEYSNGTITYPSQLFQRQIGVWTQKRFLAAVDNWNTSVRLIVEVKGRNTMLYSILGCSPYGDLDVTMAKTDKTAKGFSISNLNSNCSRQCLHGGKFNENRKKCDCPTGFMGDKCQEGCGANYYGNNCTSICSDFRLQCKGMVFCKADFPCHCAPGYKGEDCTSACEEGKYGVNCNFDCGNCQDSCDAYTGLCHSGCSSTEYYPPFCISTYKYPDTAPKVIYEDFKVVTISTDISASKGEGNIKYYQAQYKESEQSFWSENRMWMKLVPQKIEGSDIIKTNITLLKPGRLYLLKIVFIDNDGNSYQGSLVPFTSLRKTCSVPSSTGFVINHDFVPTGFKVNWTLATGPTDCPIIGYSVSLRKSWHITKYNTTDTAEFYTFQNLLPGSRYSVKVKAMTSYGDSSHSKKYSITTQDERPSYVRNLRVIKNGEKELQISWSAPKYTGGTITEYIIKYECVKYMTCSKICNSSNLYHIPSNETSIILKGLHPHAVYIAHVAASARTAGPFTQIQILTNDEEPDTAPEMHNEPVLTSTNTSVTVQWQDPRNCSLLNGFIVGYRYELVAANNTVMRFGETKEKTVSLDNLKPTSTYIVNVYAVTSGGWNRDKRISISASTKASVPEEVQSLSVYKRGREIIGLRWSLPTNVYGTLRGFSVSHCKKNKTCPPETTKYISPTPCRAWPDYFCYDINNLVYNTTYTIMVQAANTELDSYGAPANVEAQTSEGVPDPPSYFIRVNGTETSVTLKWKPPFMFNGILRSFLINLEHQNSANSTNCCRDNLLEDVRVEDEEEFYFYELRGLSPASTYIVRLSSRTTKIGSSTFLSINTKPSVPKVVPPTLVGSTQVEIPKQEPKNNLTSVFILLIASKEIENSSDIHDSFVQQKLQNILKTNFYLVNEYNVEDFPTTVEISSTDDIRNGRVGILGIPTLPSTFSVGLAAVVDYRGAKSVGFAAIRRIDNKKKN